MNKEKDELTLVEQTQRDILTYISRNTESKHLPKEQEFADILGVSRVVVREALSRLRALGFIETKRKKGTVVVTPDVFGVMNTIIASGLLDKDSLKDLYQLRLMLEIGMADFIFQNKTEEQMARIDAIISSEVGYDREMVMASDNQTKLEIARKLTESDIEFHSVLFEMTGNKLLMDFQYVLRHLFTLYSPKIKKDFHDYNVVNHNGLYKLLRIGTPDSFRTAMRLHLTTQFVNMETNIRSGLENTIQEL